MSRYAHLGTAIKDARIKRKWTQDQLAYRVGAKGGRFTVIRWEAGLHKPTEFVPQLVAELGLDEELFAEEDDEDSAMTRDLGEMFTRALDSAVEKALEKRVKS